MRAARLGRAHAVLIMLWLWVVNWCVIGACLLPLHLLDMLLGRA